MSMLTNELVLERIGAAQPQALASSETGYDGILNVETTR